MKWIEWCGLPGSGKTTICRAVLSGAQGRVLSSQDAAVMRAFRRRPDGWLKGGLKRMPGWVWNRFMNMDNALPEWHAFSSAHVGLLRLVYEELDRPDLSTREAELVTGALMRTGILYELIRRYDEGPAPVLIEEGFVHRSFTLFGYQPGEMIPEAGVQAFVESAPLPDVVVWVQAAPEVCLQRMRKRAGRTLSIRLQEKTEAEQMATLQKGAACLEVATHAVEKHGARVVRVQNDGDLDLAVKPLADLF